MTRCELTISLLIAATLSQGVALGDDGLAPPEAPARGELERELVERTRAALGEATFAARNAAAAEAVAHESSYLANRAVALQDAERQHEIERIFRASTLEAGRAFEGAFTPDGKPIPAEESTYKKAISAAGGVAYRALGPTMEQLEPSLARRPGLAVRMGEEAVANSTIKDVAKVVARDLGMERVPFESAAELVRAIDRAVPQDDRFREEIAKIPTRPTGEPPLHPRQLETLSVGTRLTKATWEAGQVHRAAWEGTTRRIESGPGSAFGTLRTRLYEQTRAEYQTREDPPHRVRLPKLHQEYRERWSQDVADEARRIGFARVVFEVWKSVIQLKKAQQASVASPEASERHQRKRQAFQQHLAEQRAAELSQLTRPALLAKALTPDARARGLKVGVNTSRDELIRRLSGLASGNAQPTAVNASAPKGETTSFSELLERVGQRGGRGKGGRRGR